jgi:hypothetical protein
MSTSGKPLRSPNTGENPKTANARARAGNDFGTNQVRGVVEDYPSHTHDADDWWGNEVT